MPGDITPHRLGLVVPENTAPAVWRDIALRELSGARQEAAEEGYAPPSELAEANARHVIDTASRLCRLAPAVYPTEDQEIAIQFVDRAAQWAVLILCDSDGGAACFVSAPGPAAGGKRNGRARFDVAEDLIGFMMTQLRRLQQAMV